MADELDELYEIKPEEFTALRTKLAAAAKQRGDTDTAKQISVARKPTAAAWVVNRVALRDQDIRTRLAGLGERLRDAHGAMDGDRIRELSARAASTGRGPGTGTPSKKPNSRLRPPRCATTSPAPCRPRSPTRRWRRGWAG